MRDTTLEPGQQTILNVQAMMHPGMEGQHRFLISLPVWEEDGTGATLQMLFIADFR